MDKCPLCKRNVPETVMERHHLDTKRKSDEIEEICRQCHRQLHALFRNYELRDEKRNLNSVEGLLENKRFQKALKFIRKQEPTKQITIKQSNR